MISKKLNRFCGGLNYIKHFLILTSAITGCISISIFASLVCILIGTTSSAILVKVCVITAIIKSNKPIIKKKKKNYDKIVLLAKTKLNRIELLISRTLIDSNISHDDFVLINNVLKVYDDIKEELRKLKSFKNTYKQCYRT